MDVSVGVQGKEIPVVRTYLACAASYVAASASVCAALTTGGSWIRYPLFAPLGLLAVAWVASTALARSR
jgi:hypothetical protein